MSAPDARGEFGLIERIIHRLGDAAARDILVPPGDDAAAWRGRGSVTVATTDAMVEGVHWRASDSPDGPATMSWTDVGWRAIVANVSDIAAMGAVPDFALISAILGPSLAVGSALDCLVDGIAEACRAHEVRVAGGDLDRGAQSVVAVTLIGHLDGEAALRRDGARVGDVVAVSGHPGASAAGLALIEAGRDHEPAFGSLVQAHRRPRARVVLGHGALESGLLCAIDISDGVLQDLGHLAERSRVGIEVELNALPVASAALAAFGRERALDLCLGGGEDFELALTGPAARIEGLSTSSLPVTVVGRVVEAHPGEAWALDERGERYVPPSIGWDHFRGVATS